MRQPNPTSRSRLWRHTPLDLIFVFYILFFAMGLALWLWHFERLPFWANASICLLAGLGHFYNYIVVNHELMHTPFFTRRWLNLVLFALSSVTLVYPMSIIDAGHKLHHVFNNDRRRNGTTKDPSSTWLQGKDGKQEPFLSYMILNYFRANTPVAFSESLASVWERRKLRIQLLLETGAILAALTAVVIINAWFLIPLFLFSYLGWALTDLQNYFEHYRASNPDSRYANSVSYYGRLYNFFMFNEGYHQEHHIEPGTHWSKRPAVRARYRNQMEAAAHYVSPVPLSVGFLDRSPLPEPAGDPLTDREIAAPHLK